MTKVKDDKKKENIGNNNNKKTGASFTSCLKSSWGATRKSLVGRIWPLGLVLPYSFCSFARFILVQIWLKIQK